MSNPRQGNAHESTWAQAAVLVVLSVLLFAEGPDLRFFSGVLGIVSPMARDPFGGLVRVGCVLSLVAYASTMGRRVRWARMIRAGTVAVFFVSFLVLPTLSDIGERQVFGLVLPDGSRSEAHDGGVLQTEAALDALVAGRSPYSVDYRDTIMAEGADSDPAVWTRWGIAENPAFDFFPYPPGVLLASLPAYGLSHALLGWYDQRLTYLLCLAVLALVLGYGTNRAATLAARRRADALPAAPDEAPSVPLLGATCVALVALDPLLAYFVPAGRNDLFFVTGLVLTVAAWRGERWRLAGVGLAATCALKQFAWPLVPLLLVHAYKRNRLRPTFVAFISISAAIWLPFILWDAQDMLHDLLVGQGSLYPYRTRGYGVTDLWVFLGLVDSPTSSFSNTPLLVAVAGGAVGLGVVRVLQRGDIGTALRYYGLTLFAVLFFGRFFAANHFGAVLSVWLVTALVYEGAFQRRAAEVDDDDD